MNAPELNFNCPTVVDKGMITYAMESFKFLIFDTFAKMLKTIFLLCYYGV